jgi:hypothetical protein
MSLSRTALSLIAGSIIGLAGCSGSSPSLPPTPPVIPTSVIFVTPPPTSLAINASTSLSAAAIFTNATVGNSQVTWSVTCGTPNACGTFSANANSAAVTYTAPAAIPSGTNVTVTATSVADTTKSVSATITIVAPIPISVSFFVPPPASIQVNTAASLLAAIANDVSANPQIQWSVSCNATACGSFNPGTTTNEAPAAFTAPAAIPPGGTVTVTATSVTDPTKSVSASIAITASTPTLANGTYVFQLSGLVGTQANFTTGVFAASNGTITGGEQDSINYSSDSDGSPFAFPSLLKITGGSYAPISSGNLQVSLQLGPDAVETLTGTLTSSAQGFVAAINGSPASGTLDLQTTTAVPSGGYALSLFGGDQYTNAAWIGGILNIDNPGAISGAGSILDVIDSQPGYSGTQSLGASTISTPDATGRVQLQLLPASPSTLPPLYLTGYIIDSTHIRLIETGDLNDNTNFQGVLGGTALGQGTSTGQFAITSIAGSSYVFGAQGNDTHGTLQLAGVFTPKADGTLTGTLNWNDLTNNSTQTPLPFTGTYTVDPTGRVTLSNLTDGSTFNYGFHLYLAANNNALLLSNDKNDIFSGQSFQQQTAAFPPAAFSGNYGLNATTYISSNSYGTLEPVNTIGTLASDASTGTNAVAGFASTSGLPANFAITGTFSPTPNGIFEGTLAGFNPASRTTAGNFTMYLVDSTQAILIETDNKQLNLGYTQNLQ